MTADGQPAYPDLDEAEARLDYFYRTLERLDAFLAPLLAKLPADLPPSELAKNAGAAMDDDFNTAAAIGHLYDAFVLANKLLDDPKAMPKPERQQTLAAIARDARCVGATLGIMLRPPSEFLLARRDRLCVRRNIDRGAVEARIADRTAARAAKDFKRADEIRAELKSTGVEFMDTPAGTTWRVTSLTARVRSRDRCIRFRFRRPDRPEVAGCALARVRLLLPRRQRAGALWQSQPRGCAQLHPRGGGIPVRRRLSLVVLACNTASAQALRTLQQRHLPAHRPDRRILGVVRPSAEALAGLPPGAIPGVTRPSLAEGTVAVLGTVGTVASGSYGLELAKLAPRLRLIEQACPLWVPLVEAGETSGPGVDYFLHKYLDPLFVRTRRSGLSRRTKGWGLGGQTRFRGGRGAGLGVGRAARIGLDVRRAGVRTEPVRHSAHGRLLLSGSCLSIGLRRGTRSGETNTEVYGTASRTRPALVSPAMMPSKSAGAVFSRIGATRPSPAKSRLV